MDEFARLIYEQWAKAQMDRDLYFDKGSDLMNRLEKILSRDLSDEIYETFCDSCQEVEQNAFIDGFAYACISVPAAFVFAYCLVGGSVLYLRYQKYRGQHICRIYRYSHTKKL